MLHSARESVKTSPQWLAEKVNRTIKNPNLSLSLRWLLPKIFPTENVRHLLAEIVQLFNCRNLFRGSRILSSGTDIFGSRTQTEEKGTIYERQIRPND